MKKHGCLWWVFIGWWWVPITLPFRIPVWIIRWILKPRKKPTAEPARGGQETLNVVGISYRPEALEALGKKNPNFAKSEQELQEKGLTGESIWEYSFSPRKHRNVELVPEPDNPVDKNAIMVVVDGQHIGYIAAESCAHIHELLKADQIQEIKCSIGGGRKKEFTKYGDKYILESDFCPYKARLTITKKTE